MTPLCHSVWDSPIQEFVMAAPDVDHPAFLSQLSRIFELSRTNERRLLSYWKEVLEPHVDDRAPLLAFMSWDTFREALHSMQQEHSEWLRPARNRLRISELVLLRAVTESLKRYRALAAIEEKPSSTAEEYFWAKKNIYTVEASEGWGVSAPGPWVPQTKPPPSLPPSLASAELRRLVSVIWKEGLSDLVEDKDEPETAIVLKNIADVLKSTAEQLASSNKEIEAFLSAMEEKEAAIKSSNKNKEAEEKADERAGASSRHT
jgi:hypothetical protein